MRFVAAAVMASGLWGCTTPCSQLRSHAESCEFAESRWVDERDSVCHTTRRHVGKTAFDHYSTCVVESECSEVGAVARCREEFLPGASQNTCTRFKLWAAGCGLEPIGTDDDCQGVTGSAGEIGFEAWVDCISEDGCPVPNDERFNRCQNLLPPEVNDLLAACTLIEEWTTECAGQGVSAFPIEPISVAECFAQAQLWSVPSYLEYAQCQHALACDDLTGRVVCFGELRLQDRTQITTQCEELIAFSATCGSGLGGGSTDACINAFARFSPETMDAYVACITAAPCGDTVAALQCGTLLVLQ